MDASPEATSSVLMAEPRDSVVLLTLNRPQARNALSFDLWADLSAALDRILAHDPLPRAVVLTGADNFFSAGGDLKTPPAQGTSAVAPAARLEMAQRVIGRLRALPIPVIAAVEGGAYGVGWSLALACDMIIAADRAKFCAPFLGLGVVPDGGCAWFLRRQIGPYKAAEILYSERVVPAAEALALGLVSTLAPAGTAVEAALDFAARMGKDNRHSLELTKRLLHAAEATTLTDHNALELAYGVMCQTGAEVARGRAQMAAKKAK